MFSPPATSGGDLEFPVPLRAKGQVLQASISRAQHRNSVLQDLAQYCLSRI